MKRADPFLFCLFISSQSKQFWPKKLVPIDVGHVSIDLHCCQGGGSFLALNGNLCSLDGVCNQSGTTSIFDVGLISAF